MYIVDKYVLFIYYSNKYNYYFLFELFEFNYIEENPINPKISYPFYCKDNDFDLDKSLNDIIKINDSIVAFIYTSSLNNNNDDDRRNLNSNDNILYILIIKKIKMILVLIDMRSF